MRLYRLLIVDDEPHVVSAMTSLLLQQEDLPLDIYTAYGGREAVSIMRQGKIDLLITDIQMPDMTGIELVDATNRMWPMCRTIFLTAHSDFGFAYEAIRRHVVSYILKSDDDEHIVSEVRKALESIREDDGRQVRENSLKTGNEDGGEVRQLLFDLLAPREASADSPSCLPLLGFADREMPLFLIVAIFGGAEGARASADDFIVRNMLVSYLGRCLTHVVCRPEEKGRLFMLIQLNEADVFSAEEPGDLRQWLSGMLESVQTALSETAHFDVSFIVSPRLTEERRIGDAYRALAEWTERLSAGGEPFVYNAKDDPGDASADDRESEFAANTIHYIKEYVNAHVTEDLSLLRLSAVTGYNGTYLSNIFHRQTGQLLSRYIAERKLMFIDALLRDPGLSIETVCARAGFASRPYFNRYIKRETGMTPKNYRLKLLLEDGE